MSDTKSDPKIQNDDSEEEEDSDEEESDDMDDLLDELVEKKLITNKKEFKKFLKLQDALLMFKTVEAYGHKSKKTFYKKDCVVCGSCGEYVHCQWSYASMINKDDDKHMCYDCHQREYDK